MRIAAQAGSTVCRPTLIPVAAFIALAASCAAPPPFVHASNGVPATDPREAYLGSWIRSDYLDALKRTRSPHAAFQFAHEVVVNVFWGLLIDPDGAEDRKGYGISINNNFHEGYGGGEVAESALTTLFREKGKVARMRWAGRVYSRLSAPISELANRTVIAGSYRSPDGKEFLFAPDGTARWDGRPIRYEVAMDVVEFSSDTLILDPDARRQFVDFAWRDGKLNLFETYAVGDDFHRSFPQPMLVLTQSSSPDAGGRERCGKSPFQDRRLEDQELDGKSATELHLLRNMIFAHHCYRFKKWHLEKYAAYTLGEADQRPNYRPGGQEVRLNAMEEYNLELIKRREQRARRVAATLARIAAPGEELPLEVGREQCVRAALAEGDAQLVCVYLYSTRYGPVAILGVDWDYRELEEWDPIALYDYFKSRGRKGGPASLHVLTKRIRAEVNRRAVTQGFALPRY